MDLYVIRCRGSRAKPEELQAAGTKSAGVGEDVEPAVLDSQLYRE
jgi:hypothetical protein